MERNFRAEGKLSKDTRFSGNSTQVYTCSVFFLWKRGGWIKKIVEGSHHQFDELVRNSKCDGKIKQPLSFFFCLL